MNAMQRHAYRRPALYAEDILRVAARYRAPDGWTVMLFVNAGEP